MNRNDHNIEMVLRCMTKDGKVLKCEVKLSGRNETKWLEAKYVPQHLIESHLKCKNKKDDTYSSAVLKESNDVNTIPMNTQNEIEITNKFDLSHQRVIVVDEVFNEPLPIQEEVFNKSLPVQENVFKINFGHYRKFDSFYVNLLPNAVLTEIDDFLTNPPKEGFQKAKLPIVERQRYLALDYNGLYYRIVVRAARSSNMYSVQFLDEGEIQDIPQDRIYHLDNSIYDYPPQAINCELAYLKYCGDYWKIRMNTAKEYDTITEARICYIHGKKHGVILYQEAGNLDTTCQAELLRNGYAKTHGLPEMYKRLKEIEEENSQDKGNLMEIDKYFIINY
jgi:hypothetical protein